MDQNSIAIVSHYLNFQVIWACLFFNGFLEFGQFLFYKGEKIH